MSFFFATYTKICASFFIHQNLLDQTQIYVFLFDNQRENKKKISKTDLNVNLY
jgi:hypothetical protein